MMNASRVLGITALVIALIGAGCSGGGGGSTTPTALTPILSTPKPVSKVFTLAWTSPFTTGDQSGTITFPNPAGSAVATLQINDTLSGSVYGLPYDLQVVPECVVVSATDYDTNYTVSPKAPGSCTIKVTDTYGSIQTISVVVRSL